MIGHGVLFTEVTLTVLEVYFVTDSRLPIKSSTEQNLLCLSFRARTVRGHAPSTLKRKANKQEKTAFFLLRMLLNAMLSFNKHFIYILEDQIHLLEVTERQKKLIKTYLKEILLSKRRVCDLASLARKFCERTSQSTLCFVDGQIGSRRECASRHTFATVSSVNTQAQERHPYWGGTILISQRACAHGHAARSRDYIRMGGCLFTQSDAVTPQSVM